MKILDNKGVTLVEILMAIVILSVVMIIVYSMLFQTYEIVESSSIRVTDNRMVEFVFEDISNYIRKLESYNRSNEEDNKDHYLIESYSSKEKKTIEILIIYDENYNILKLLNNENDEVIKRINNVTNFNINRLDNSNIFNLNLTFNDGVEFNKFKTITARNF